MTLSLQKDFKNTLVRASRTQSDDLRAMSFLVHADNLADIARIYGPEILVSCSSHLQAIAAKMFPHATLACNGTVGNGTDGWLLTIHFDSPALPDDGYDGSFRFGKQFCAAAALQPLEIDGHNIHLGLRCELLDIVTGAMDAAGSAPIAPPQARMRPYAVTRYQSHMAAAATILSAIRNNHLHLAWQPVCGRDDLSDILYYQARPTLRTQDGTLLDIAEMDGPLAELHLARIVDQHILTMILDELETAPLSISLGVRISWQCTEQDECWHGILARLNARPDLAMRLVLELGDGASRDFGQSTALFNKLRRAGVRIALDDFGLGDASIRHCLAVAPDIIRIARLFVQNARRGEREKRIFDKLTALAGSLADILVIDGVDSDDLLKIIDDCEKPDSIIQYIQGESTGSRTILREWCW